MNAKQRFAAMAKGEPLDRLPCVPIVGNTSARVIGCAVSTLRDDGRLLADAQIAAYRRFGYDGIRVFTDLYVLAEAMGAKVHAPLDETAYLDTPAIAGVADIETLRPADPRRDGNLPAHLEAAARCLDAVGDEVPVSCALTGPFTTASFLIGADTLVKLMIRRPEAVHRLCTLALESALRLAEAMLDLGCAPSLTDPMGSSTVISPRQFQEFAAPYLSRLIAYIHSRGPAVTLHICGRTRRIWNAMVEAGADCLSIDNEADLAEAKVDVGDRVRLMGNVPPSEIMFKGTPGEVRRAVRACVAKAWDTPRGYVVASGCSLPTETPFTNIDAMMEAVAELGWPPRVDTPENEAAAPASA